MFIRDYFVCQSDPWPLQPIQTFKNPMFMKMLDIASRAPPSRGVTLPSPKKTRAQIIHTFKQQMYLLRDRLNVRVQSCHTSSKVHTDIRTLGPHCFWGNQSNLRCVAGSQHGRVLCRYRALDRGACPRRMDPGACFARVRAVELYSQRKSSRASIIPDSQPPSSRS